MDRASVAPHGVVVRIADQRHAVVSDRQRDPRQNGGPIQSAHHVVLKHPAPRGGDEAVAFDFGSRGHEQFIASQRDSAPAVPELGDLCGGDAFERPEGSASPKDVNRCAVLGVHRIADGDAVAVDIHAEAPVLRKAHPDVGEVQLLEVLPHAVHSAIHAHHALQFGVPVAQDHPLAVDIDSPGADVAEESGRLRKTPARAAALELAHEVVPQPSTMPARSPATASARPKSRFAAGAGDNTFCCGPTESEP